MIQEIQLNGLNTKTIKTKQKPPPRSINENLPPCYFTSILNGSKGSGKPHSLIKIFKNYKKYPIYDNEGHNLAHKLDMRIVVLCTTIIYTANPIYKTLQD
jgi:hypothetical protein